jgi:hypothetical protein
MQANPASPATPGTSLPGAELGWRSGAGDAERTLYLSDPGFPGFTHVFADKLLRISSLVLPGNAARNMNAVPGFRAAMPRAMNSSIGLRSTSTLNEW